MEKRMNERSERTKKIRGGVGYRKGTKDIRKNEFTKK
jgi:hypothetical protein